MKTDGLLRSVLSAVDFSKQSSMALQYAAAIVTRSKGRLIVLYVNEPLLMAGAAAAAYDARKLTEDSRKQLQRFVERALDGSGLRLSSVTCLVKTGNPAAEIDRTARREKCGLIVVGTHGIGGPWKVLFGSTTKRLLQLTKRPVLVIPPLRTRSRARS